MPLPTPIPNTTRIFPNAQRLLIEHLKTYAGTDRVAIQTPADLADKLPFIRVQLIPGPAGRLNAYSTLAVDVYATTYDDADQTSRKLVEYLAGQPTCPVAGIDTMTCESLPADQPWGDGSIRRFAMSFRAVARRRTS